MCLAGVFDHHETVPIRELTDGAHVRRMSVQVNRNNGFCAAGDGSFQSFHVQGVSEGINVYQHRLGAGVGDAQCGGDEAVCCSDDLVTRANVEGPQSQLQCRCAGVHPDRIGRVAELSKLFLEEAHFAPEDKVSILDYFRYRVINLSRNCSILDS